MDSKLTRHGKKRGKERIGIGKGSMERQADLALTRGLRHKDMEGRLHKWVTAQSYLYNVKRSDNQYIVYNNKLFIFNDDYSKLITVLNLPANLQKLASQQLKKSANTQ